jgi:hypothetical protein
VIACPTNLCSSKHRKLPTLTCLLTACLMHATRVEAAFNWEQGDWGVQISTNGQAGSPVMAITFPGGSASGNALEVYHKNSAIDWPQRWVFLTQGTWRQVAPDSEFLSSYHLLRFYTSTDQAFEDPSATSIQVIGVTAKNQLHLRLDYRSEHLPSGDAFMISAELFLDPPTSVTTAMEADIAVTNVSGRAVVPYADNFHGKLRQQWRLFSVDSMYVADNLTETFPAWYDALDPAHNYVGTIGNTSYLDDGHSVNGNIPVSMHDAKFIVAGTTEVALDHAIPSVVVPGFEWYPELVLMDVASDSIGVLHGYDPRRNHHVELLEASGITHNLSNLTWCSTFNRNDTNMVDGDNVRVQLSLDTFLASGSGIWANGANQRFKLRLSVGEPLSLRIVNRRKTSCQHPLGC